MGLAQLMSREDASSGMRIDRRINPFNLGFQLLQAVALVAAVVWLQATQDQRIGALEDRVAEQAIDIGGIVQANQARQDYLHTIEQKAAERDARLSERIAVVETEMKAMRYSLERIEKLSEEIADKLERP